MVNRIDEKRFRHRLCSSAERNAMEHDRQVKRGESAMVVEEERLKIK